MNIHDIRDCLERSPIIPAIPDHLLGQAIASDAEIIFDLKASLATVADSIRRTHEAHKKIFIHIDLADGIGKDKTGVEYLARLGADGIISTKASLIRHGNDAGLVTVQRFFALDSKGVDAISDMLSATSPDLIEIMPGIASKVIRRLTAGNVPVIAGGLIETKQEVTEALGNGADGVSTGKQELWYI